MAFRVSWSWIIALVVAAALSEAFYMLVPHPLSNDLMALSWALRPHFMFAVIAIVIVSAFAIARHDAPFYALALATAGYAASFVPLAFNLSDQRAGINMVEGFTALILLVAVFGMFFFTLWRSGVAIVVFALFVAFRFISPNFGMDWPRGDELGVVVFDLPLVVLLVYGLIQALRGNRAAGFFTLGLIGFLVLFSQGVDVLRALGMASSSVPPEELFRVVSVPWVPLALLWLITFAFLGAASQGEPRREGGTTPAR